MTYYIIGDKEEILGISDSCPDPQKEANEYGCSVYIIQGQHTGLSAEPEKVGTCVECKTTNCVLDEDNICPECREKLNAQKMGRCGWCKNLVTECTCEIKSSCGS